MGDYVLVLNAGSSSLKFQIFAIDCDRLDRRVVIIGGGVTES